jgi:hypothetical protein
LQEYLEDILFPENLMPGGVLPALYCDAIFQNINHMIIIAQYDLIGNQQKMEFLRRLTFRMSGIRKSIEHMYGQLFDLFLLFKTPLSIEVL